MVIIGQYHVLANLDKREVVDPHALGLGLKQWEQIGAFYGSLADALYILTTTSPARGGGDLERVSISGRWVGDRVVVLGDYTVDDDIPDFPNAGSLYHEACDPKSDWTDISDTVAKDLATVFGGVLA